MTGARWIGPVFAAGVVLAAVAMGTLSWQAVRLDRRALDAAAREASRDRLRLALWRMDSALATLLAREASRPYFHYRPFYPADRAYGAMEAPPSKGEPVAPSPLLTLDDPLIVLHFERGTEGVLRSPQVPGADDPRAAALGIGPERIARYDDRLRSLGRVLGAGASDGAGPQRAGRAVQGAAIPEPARELRDAAVDYQARQQVADIARGSDRAPTVAGVEVAQAAGAARESSGVPHGAERSEPGNAAEPPAHADEDAMTESLAGQAGSAPVAEKAEAPAERADGVETGAIGARWAGVDDRDAPVLLLERAVRLGGSSVTQGVWLDWASLRAWLLEQAGDAGSGARLEPRPGDGPTPGNGALLAAIPAALTYEGPVPARASGSLRGPLLLSWGALALAVAAIGLGLRSMSELAARRGRFVAAVTHELRTPLTTFVLYTEMLDGGMVSGEDAKRAYIGTLRREAARLSRIVESVLAYARLGSERPPDAGRREPAGALVERVRPALAALCQRSGAVLEVRDELGEAGARAGVAADAASVERILLNLVDNACRYGVAPGAPGARVTLTVRLEGRMFVVRVRDEGPGVASADRRRLFGAFERGRSLAHESTPGLGLGLALSRALARRMGGDVALETPAGPGALFVLRLPAAPPDAPH